MQKKYYQLNNVFIYYISLCRYQQITGIMFNFNIKVMEYNLMKISNKVNVWQQVHNLVKPTMWRISYTNCLTDFLGLTLSICVVPESSLAWCNRFKLIEKLKYHGFHGCLLHEKQQILIDIIK